MPILTEPTDAQLHETFNEQGIVILPGYLSGDVVREVDAYLQTLLADTEKGFGNPAYGETFDTWVKVWPIGGVEACERLWAEPRITEATRAVLGEDYTLDAQSAFCTPAGCGQAWHQDSWSSEPDQFVLNRIVFTRDYTPAQGELVYVPGSHRMGNLPPGGNFEPIEREQRVAPTAGTLVLMNSRCFHQVSKNQSDAPRIQVNSRVRPSRAAADLCRYAIFRTGRWDFRQMCKW
ncbi:MAG: phytanoyl-CoA dioxygenase family protein [bacterium]